MATFSFLERFGLEGFDDLEVRDVEFCQNVGIKPFSHHQDLVAGIDGNIIQLRVQADGQISRDRPGCCCPDDKGNWLLSQLSKAFREFIQVWKLDVD